MARHIIFIHGRNRKPWSMEADQDFTDSRQRRASRDCLLRLWTRAFLTGLKRHARPEVYEHWRAHRSHIHMAYYGDILNLLNGNRSDGVCSELWPTLQGLIDRTRDEPRWRVARSFLQDRAVEVSAFISQGLGFKDDLLLKNLRDLREYLQAHAIGSQIRRRLHDILDPLLEDRHRVAVVGHSLGTLVAYDVLWKISHRSEFSHLHRRKVDLFATMGSPMGNQAFLDKFRIDADFDRDSQFPRNVVRWHNFTTRGDFVAHDARIKNDLRRRGFLRYLEEMEDHTKLFGPYLGRKGRWNPHKSFGYLIQEELAEVINPFTELPPRQ